jgi:hypothetical protein
MNIPWRALRSLSFLAIVVAAGAAGAAPPEVRPIPATTAHATPAAGGGPRAGGAAGAVTTQATANALPPSPPGPPVLGWPHQVLYGSNDRCARNPFPLEVIVWEDPNFTGRCAVLQPGFYPRDIQMMVRNDAISSIKVGQLVRARVFKDTEYAGGFTIFGASSSTGKVPSDWNDVISSIRVEPAARHPNCDDLIEGEIGLYSDDNFGGDCVVLRGDGTDSYATAAQMGIANDSVSSMWNNTAKELIGYGDSSFSSQFGINVPPHTKVAELSKGGTQYLIVSYRGIDDNMSSLIMR